MKKGRKSLPKLELKVRSGDDRRTKPSRRLRTVSVSEENRQANSAAIRTVDRLSGRRNASLGTLSAALAPTFK